jgi:indole-3-acetate monooxygenase
MSLQKLLAHVSAMAPLVRAEMPAGRRACRLPAAVVDAAVEHGLFRLWIPRRYDGFELTLPAALEIYAAAARVDGSFGWAVMIGSGGGLFAAYLEQATAARLFGPRAAVVAGSGAAGGTAARVAGGYRVSGRWRYASGAHYATIFTANCRVTENAVPVATATGPRIRAMSFRPADVVIDEAWDTSGLRATGSHDISVREVFVAESATFSVFDDQPCEDGPLYRLPFEVLTELPVGAVVLGVAQRALEEFTALARVKAPHGGPVPLDRFAAVQAAVAAAHTQIGAARTALFGLAESAWRATLAGDPPQPNDYTPACVNTVRSLLAAIAGLVPYAGMNAIQNDDEFAIAWRDLEAAAAHYSVSPVNLLSSSDFR